MSRELVATTATDDALCSVAARTSDNRPAAPTTHPQWNCDQALRYHSDVLVVDSGPLRAKFDIKLLGAAEMAAAVQDVDDGLLVGGRAAAGLRGPHAVHCATECG
jgi:hypothetical protein